VLCQVLRLAEMPKDQELITRLVWAVNSMNAYLDEIRYFWAQALGITGPQFLIVIALADLDKGEGTPLNAVANRLQVNSSFVTTQSKVLEKRGFLRRKSSASDARVVLLSLTDRTYKHLAKLAPREESLNDFIFHDMDGADFEALTKTLEDIDGRLVKSGLRLRAEL
jgi:DNA-binding MarR family transcriptional regulator